jgi:putative ABC transport system permease protein
MRVTPPRLARWLLTLALPSGLRGDTILGDLAEEFQHRATRSSPRRAAAWYWRAAGAVSIGVSLERWRRRRAPSQPPATRASLMDTLLQDIRHGVRTLLKARRFTMASLATLAIGIGAATAIFTIVNAMLLRPLPYRDSTRLIWASETTSTGSTMSLSWPTYLDWHARLASFESFASSRGTTYTLTGLGDAARLDGRQTSWDFLSVLGVTPALGRGFAPEDDRPSPVHPILISDGFWTTTLGRDPGVLGRRLTIDGQPHEIVGVLPPGFRYSVDYAIYEPVGILTDNESFLDRGNHQGLYAIGRLKPGVTESAARQEIEALSAALAHDYPNTNSGQGAHLESLASRVVGDLKPALVVLISAVGLLLVIACVNVANLLIAHGATRWHEMAVRSALGGGRVRLIRQLLVESSVLSSAGGALGLVTGWGLLNALIAVAPPTLPRLEEVRLDGQALLFALGITMASGLLFGVLPAVIASAADGQQLVVRASRTGASASHRLRRGLLVAEVALALVLLCGAGLMIRTMWRLTTADPGFAPDHLLTMKYAIRSNDWTDARTQAFHDDVVAKTKALPGVVHAGLTLSLPIEGSNWGSVFIVGDQPPPPRANLPSAAFTPVSPGYFDTLGLRLRAGRVLAEADRGNTPRVAVVNERFAKHFWPNENPVGKKLKQGWPEWNTPWQEIVGVVNDIKLNGVESDAPMQVYMPLAQSPSRSVILMVRTDEARPAAASSIRSVIAGLNGNLPVYDVRTMDDVLGLRVARKRLSMIVFAVFGAIALVLAAVGLYGVVSHGVADRTREIGVRMALGATRRQVLNLFLGQSAATTAAGIALGTGAALLLSRFMRELLFQVEPNDATTICTVVGTLFVVSIAACYLPARRATRVDPTVALRGE